TLGGPLKKDKMFLFGNYEGFRQRLALSSVAVVPDQQVRQGLLPCYLATPTACGSNPGQFITVPNLKPGMLPYANNFWPAPTGNALNLFTGSDDVHIIRGNHSFSFGGWLQRVQENQGGPAQNKAGTVAYPTLLAFLQDSPTAFNANVVVTPVGYRQWLGAW